MNWADKTRAALPTARRLVASSEEPRAALQRSLAVEVLGDDAEAFLAWAKEDPTWRLVVAECATQVCAKPREAAAFILVEGWLQELVDEGVLPDDD